MTINNTFERTFVIGDIHGCIDEFVDLVQKLEYSRKTDRLVLVGDLIDRGPDPAAVIQYAREIGAECTSANHEETALRWRRHEKKKILKPDYINPMRPVPPDRLAQWQAIPDADWDWLESLPLIIDLGCNWITCHAGLMPGVPVSQQEARHVQRIRWVDDITGKMVTPDEAGNQPSGSTFWGRLWKGPNVVYGHYVYDDPECYVDGTQTVLGIDTGCCHGNRLTAFVLEHTHPERFRLESVPAKKVYAIRKPWNE